MNPQRPRRSVTHTGAAATWAAVMIDTRREWSGSVNRWNFHDVEQLREASDHIRKHLRLCWFRNIVAATQLMALVNFMRVIGRGQDRHGNFPQLLMFLHLSQDFQATHLGQIDIQKEHIRTPGVTLRPLSSAKKEIQGFLTVSQSITSACHSGPQKVPLNQSRMAVIILGD